MSLERTVRDLDLLLRSVKAGLQQLPLPSPQWGGAGGGVEVSDFPAKIIERARDWKVTRSVWLFFSLIAEVRDDPELNAAAASIAPVRPIRSTIRLMVPDSRTTRLKRLNHRIAAALLWPVLFDNPLLVARFVANHPLVSKLHSS